jgi:hypothetical protein
MDEWVNAFVSRGRKNKDIKNRKKNHPLSVPLPPVNSKSFPAVCSL